MNNKSKTEKVKNKEVKLNEKPIQKAEKKVKDKAEKTVKKKKKLKKKGSSESGSNKDYHPVNNDEPEPSLEIQAIDRHLVKTDTILKEEKDISNKLDNYLNLGSIRSYLDDDFLNNNRNLLAKSNNVLEKYENNLYNIAGVIQNTIERLEDSKCK